MSAFWCSSKTTCHTPMRHDNQRKWFLTTAIGANRKVYQSNDVGKNIWRNVTTSKACIEIPRTKHPRWCKTEETCGAHEKRWMSAPRLCVASIWLCFNSKEGNNSTWTLLGKWPLEQAYVRATGGWRRSSQLTEHACSPFNAWWDTRHGGSGEIYTTPSRE